MRIVGDNGYEGRMDSQNRKQWRVKDLSRWRSLFTVNEGEWTKRETTLTTEGMKAMNMPDLSIRRRQSSSYEAQCYRMLESAKAC